MQVDVQDSSIFKKVTVTIVAETVPEIGALCAIFNNSIKEVQDSLPTCCAKDRELINEAIAESNMPLWEAMLPVYEKLYVNS